MKPKNNITPRSSAAEYLTYIAAVGEQEDSIEIRYEDENIWLTQKMMATLYDVSLSTINEHIKKIFSFELSDNGYKELELGRSFSYSEIPNNCV